MKEIRVGCIAMQQAPEGKKSNFFILWIRPLSSFICYLTKMFLSIIIYNIAPPPPKKSQNMKTSSNANVEKNQVNSKNWNAKK